MDKKSKFFLWNALSIFGGAISMTGFLVSYFWINSLILTITFIISSVFFLYTYLKYQKKFFNELYELDKIDESGGE